MDGMVAGRYAWRGDNKRYNQRMKERKREKRKEGQKKINKVDREPDAF